jgi:succinylarginine dihydrolase
LEASHAVARLHRLDAASVIFAQQLPSAIDAGGFHNDVILMGNQHVLIFHERAFLEQDELKRTLESAVDAELRLIEVAEKDITLEESVATYLFNSQLVTLPSGTMALIVPKECEGAPRVWSYLQGLVADYTEIERIDVVDIRQSMRNGGGPACLRLRVVLRDAELASMNGATLMNEALFNRLSSWVATHYRDRLTEDDLADPKLLEESRTALDELTQILELGSVYAFQS